MDNFFFSLQLQAQNVVLLTVAIVLWHLNLYPVLVFVQYLAMCYKLLVVFPFIYLDDWKYKHGEYVKVQHGVESFVQWDQYWN